MDLQRAAGTRGRLASRGYRILSYRGAEASQIRGLAVSVQTGPSAPDANGPSSKVAEIGECWRGRSVPATPGCRSETSIWPTPPTTDATNTAGRIWRVMAMSWSRSFRPVPRCRAGPMACTRSTSGPPRTGPPRAPPRASVGSSYRGTRPRPSAVCPVSGAGCGPATGVVRTHHHASERAVRLHRRPDVAATNNAAQRSLRHLVTSRTISEGTRAPAGTTTRMTLVSLFGTWRRHRLNPLVECHALLTLSQL